MDHNQNDAKSDADQYDRDPDYKQKEQSDIELVVDEQISEQESDNLKNDQEQNGDVAESIHQNDE